MINPQYIPNIIILMTATAVPSVENTYIQYGFLGILLSILIWYSRNSYKENVRREAASETKIKDMQIAHKKEIDDERERYHELHLELMAYLKTFTHKKEE